MALQPVLVKKYSDNFELIVVQIKIGDKDIRLITGYGPQESWTDEDQLPFFTSLEEEIFSAVYEGKSIIIAMDVNSKLGPDIIPGDPLSI